MTWNPPPVSDERHALSTHLRQLHRALRNATYGLTDDQARRTPARSAISLAALLTHVTVTERVWLARARGEDATFAGDDWNPGRASLTQIVAAFDEQATATEAAAIDPSLDLDAPVAPPQGPPWYTGEPVSVRWVLFHLVEEVARHAGHADILREQLDGATAAALLATVEGWPETAGVEPWRPNES
jgi:uncharacterized damage-inducible protein DinB